MTTFDVQAHVHPDPPPEGEEPGSKTALPPQGEGWDAGGSPNWTRICRIDEIPRLGARVIKQSEGPNIAVFRTATDNFFALADRCPHRGGPLSQGIVYGERVACPLHNTNVELGTGCAVAPDKGEVQRYRVKVENGAVFIELPVKADRYAYG